jgi:transcriptional regulator with XRE-family HTH domain
MMQSEEPRPDESFGSYIQRIRRARGWTQRKVAADLGIDFTYLSKLENGRGEPPGDDTIRKLADLLGLDAETLLALAGKVPGELRQMAQEDRDFAIFLRRLPQMSPEERRHLYRRPRARQR